MLHLTTKFPIHLSSLPSLVSWRKAAQGADRESIQGDCLHLQTASLRLHLNADQLLRSIPVSGSRTGATALNNRLLVRRTYEILYAWNTRERGGKIRRRCTPSRHHSR